MDTFRISGVNQMDATKALCSACADNPHLSRRISEKGHRGKCSECGKSKHKVFDLEQMVALLAEAISRNFTIDSVTRVPIDDYGPEDGIEFEVVQNGDDLETVVYHILVQNLTFIGEIIQALMESECYEIKRGQEPFFQEGNLYAAIEFNDEIDLFGYTWENAVNELRYKQRFFSKSTLAFFDDLFQDIQKRRSWKYSGLEIYQGSVVDELDEGKVLCRARAVTEDQYNAVISEPHQQVGPPPRNKSRAGRMNAEGVVVLYCAEDQQTAIAETRPAIGTTTAVIDLVLTRKVRLLNFEHLERLLSDNWQVFLDEGYNGPLHQARRAFLAKMHDLISQPVTPGNEADYLITQSMAEYLAHYHPAAFDGIMFKSVQNQNGVNIVLFPEREAGFHNDEKFPVEYRTGSLSFHRTTKVTYTHSLADYILWSTPPLD
jgi:hypothetical protein